MRHIAPERKDQAGNTVWGYASTVIGHRRFANANIDAIKPGSLDLIVQGYLLWICEGRH